MDFSAKLNIPFVSTISSSSPPYSSLSVSVSATAACSLMIASASFFARSIVKLNSLSLPPAVSFRSVVFSFAARVDLGTDACGLGALVGVVVPDAGALNVPDDSTLEAVALASFEDSAAVFLAPPMLIDTVTGAGPSAGSRSGSLF
jgi:hypothetical protein